MIVDPDANQQSTDPVVAARIEALAGYGLSGVEIAHVLGISEEALLEPPRVCRRPFGFEDLIVI